MGSKKKKKDATYQVAVSGAKGAIRILLYVLLICVLIFVGKTAYSFGYLIFYQEPEAHTQADGQDVTVIVHEDDSVYDVGETLQENDRLSSGHRKNSPIIVVRSSLVLIF